MSEVLGEVQRDEDDAVQAFLQWARNPEICLKGIKGSDNDQQCDFIPQKMTKAYLSHPERIEELLKALFKDQEEDISPNRVRNHYLRAFAILLDIGQGKMIKHFMKQDGLRDNNLPFRKRPSNFPRSNSEAPDIFIAFNKSQWKFCACILEYDMEPFLHNDEIMPIIEMQPLGRGGSSLVFKIVVNSENDELCPQRWDQSSKQKNTYVLKRFIGDMSKSSYEAECRALRHLRHDDIPNPNIVGYLGKFTRGLNHNIFLEYANSGDLESYMMSPNSCTPGSGLEVNMFWGRLYKVVLGLQEIHNKLLPSTGPSSETLLGWHNDVTPQNILVFRDNPNSTFDCDFKLSDFGLSRFQKSNINSLAGTILDPHGTHIYGPPETLRAGAESERLSLKVQQSVDIWSLGCIFSEVAVWACQGQAYLSEYRRRRELEVAKAADSGGKGVFHYRHCLLQAVQDAHDGACRSLRKDDYLTENILKYLIPSMMKVNSIERYTAAIAGGHLRDFIHDAQQKYEETNTHTSSNTGGEHFSGKDNAKRKIPPVLPPHIQQRNPTSSSAILDDTYRNAYDTNIEQHYPAEASNLGDDGASLVLRDSRHRIPAADPPQWIPERYMPIDLNNPPTDLGSRPQTLRSIEQLKPVRLSLSEATNWKENCKKDKHSPHPPGNIYLHEIADRLHIFIIDNSWTMGPYKDRIARVIGILAYMIKNSKPNKIEMHFTLSPSHIVGETSTAFVDAVKNATYDGKCNMKGSLTSIMELYRESLGNEKRQRHLGVKWIKKSKVTGPLSVYILTDGDWQPLNSISEPVNRLVETIKLRGLSENYVGIQLIQCGHSNQFQPVFEEAVREGCNIVNTTNWDGNVWKMLLGATNQWLGSSG